MIIISIVILLLILILFNWGYVSIIGWRYVSIINRSTIMIIVNSSIRFRWGYSSLRSLLIQQDRFTARLFIQSILFI